MTEIHAACRGMPSGADLVKEAKRLEKEARTAFNEYDIRGNGLIDKDECTHVLADLGMLDGLPTASFGSLLDDAFARADADGSGKLDFQVRALTLWAGARRAPACASAPQSCAAIVRWMVSHAHVRACARARASTYLHTRAMHARDHSLSPRVRNALAR